MILVVGGSAALWESVIFSAFCHGSMRMFNLFYFHFSRIVCDSVGPPSFLFEP